MSITAISRTVAATLAASLLRAFDRVLAPPAADTGNGLLRGTCTVGMPNGTRTEYEEGDEFNQTFLNGVDGGTASYGRFDGTIQAIDPHKLVRDPYQNCAPVWPWNFRLCAG